MEVYRLHNFFKIYITNFGFDILAGLFGCIGVAVFGAEFTDDVNDLSTPNGYGFWLCACFSGALFLQGGISLCWGCGSTRPGSPDQHINGSQLTVVTPPDQSLQQTVFISSHYANQQQVQFPPNNPHFYTGATPSNPHAPPSYAGTTFNGAKKGALSTV
jgi:hypothetical protein